MREALLDKVSIFLLKKGFTIKNLTRMCFDILARKDDTILLIKVLEDANSVSREYSEEMVSFASYINASPLIIAEKAVGKLDDNVVYSRFSIYTLNLNTLSNCINKKFPFIRRSHAGLTASVSGKKFKEKREGLGYSLNAMSKKIGVTSRMIMKYESGNSEVTLNRAMKIYDLVGHEVFNEINIFSSHGVRESRLETEISKKYSELGFDASDTKKIPFDIIAKKGQELIFTEVSDNVDPSLQPLSRLFDADNLVIFNKKKPKNIPSMTKEEFMDFDKAHELVKFLKEF